jgi:hypothetical protein
MIDDRPFLAVVCACVLTIGAGGGRSSMGQTQRWCYGCRLLVKLCVTHLTAANGVARGMV